MDNEKKHARASWSGKWAFVLAGAGSAVGLGNMWRFPYLDAKYGGGTFLLVYLICVFTLGISLLLQDIALGRNAKKSVVGVFSRYGKKYSIIGIIAAAFSIAGHYIGAGLTIKNGTKIVRPVIIVVLVLLAVKIVLEMLGIL